MKAPILIIACLLANSANAAIININARLYGAPQAGQSVFRYNIGPGDYIFTLTNPNLDAGAQYMAWSGYSSGNLWEADYFVIAPANHISQGIYYNNVKATPEAVFNSVVGNPVAFHFDVADELQIGVPDGYLSDNRGGVSIKVDLIEPVPEHLHSGITVAVMSLFLLFYCHASRYFFSGRRHS
jgi:hypothetical protein